MSNPVTDMIKKAVEHHRSGDFVQAEPLYRKVLDKEPFNFHALNLLGALLGQSRRFSEAELLLRRARAIQPDSFDAAQNLSHACHSQGRHAEAVRIWREVLQKNNALYAARLKLASALLATKELAEAEACLQEAIRLSPGMPAAYVQLAELMAAGNRFEEAATVIGRGMMSCPDQPALLIRRGDFACLQGDWRTGLKFYKDALQLQPDATGLMVKIGAVAIECGDLNEARSHLARALQMEPGRTDASVNLSNILLRENRLGEARQLLLAALAVAPHAGEVHNNLGLTYKKLGERHKAAFHLRTAASFIPDNPAVHNNLGVLQQEMEQFDDAIRAYQNALKIDDQFVDALNNLGNLFSLRGEFGMAENYYRRAMTCSEDQNHANLVFRVQSFAMESRSAGLPSKVGEGQARKPRRQQEKKFSIIICSRDETRFKSIERHYETLMQGRSFEIVRIDDAKSMGEGYNRGFERSSGEILMFSHDDIEFVDPDVADRVAGHLEQFDVVGAAGTTCLVGETWGQSGWPDSHGLIAHFDESRNRYELSIFGADTEAVEGVQALDGLFFACRREVLEKLRFDEKVFDGFHFYDLDFTYSAYLMGFRLAVCPDLAAIHYSKGRFDGDWQRYAGRFLEKYLGRLQSAGIRSGRSLPVPEFASREEIRAFVGHWLEGRPAEKIRPGLNDHQVMSNYLFSLQFQTGIDAEKLYREHRRFNEVHDSRPAWSAGRGKQVRDRKKLHVGYVSPDFRFHPVGRFIAAALKFHDHDHFEISCFHTDGRQDHYTEKLRGWADHWHDCAALGVNELAERIRAENVDVLVDLAGHTGGNSLPVFIENCAPVQASFLGYPDTTGLSSIDFRIADHCTEPETPGQMFSSEKIIRLPSSYFCYTPDEHAPALSGPPSATNGFITYGISGNTAKISSETLEMVMEIMSETPGSRLVIQGNGANEGLFAMKIYRAVGDAGLDRERITLKGWQSYADYLESFSEMDIALDTTPFNFATNTCDALWMGVPVVSLSGSRHASRMGESILTAAGFPQWIARAREEYVSIAISLARDVGELKKMRLHQRELLNGSVLLDAQKYAINLEEAYLKMWKQ